MNEYKIILADGTIVNNVKRLETGQFYTTENITQDTFNMNNLTTVTIQLNDLQEIRSNQICDVFYIINNIIYFQFRNITEIEELKLANVRLEDELAATKILLGIE